MNTLFHSVIYFSIAIAVILIAIRLLFRMGFKRIYHPKNKACILWSICLPVILSLAIVSFGYIDQWQYVNSESELLRRVVVTDDPDPEKLEIKGLNHAEIKRFKDGYVVIVTNKKTSSFLPIRIIKRHSTLIKYSNGKSYLITNKSNFPPYYVHPFFLMPKLNDSTMSLEDVHASIFTEWPFKSLFKIIEIC